MTITITEWIGYIASAVLIFSFMLKNVRTLRAVNSLGALLFVIYGIFLDLAWPIIITNAFIILVNMYQLQQLAKK